jgi:hypothetical protein
MNRLIGRGLHVNKRGEGGEEREGGGIGRVTLRGGTRGTSVGWRRDLVVREPGYVWG